MLLERGRVLLKRRINSPPMPKRCRAAGKPLTIVTEALVPTRICFR
jgi:hypothetical protein